MASQSVKWEDQPTAGCVVGSMGQPTLGGVALPRANVRSQLGRGVVSEADLSSVTSEQDVALPNGRGGVKQQHQDLPTNERGVVMKPGHLQGVSALK